MSPNRFAPLFLLGALAGQPASALEPSALRPAQAPASEGGPATLQPAPVEVQAIPTAPAPAASMPATAPGAKMRVPPALKVASVSSDPRPTLAPETFIDTMRAADRYLRIAEAGGWPALPHATLKLGDRGAAISALRARLAATGDLTGEGARLDIFDTAVLAAVKRFQARHSLPETGLVGAKTLAALNVPALARHRQLVASAQRLIGSSFPFGERYVVVNIPSATVEAVERGQVARRYVAVVGKKDRASPSVETRITSVNFNPTWTVPVSLIKKDIIPHMRKDPAYLAKMKIRVLDGQDEVDPARIDWTTERAVNFTLRQDPGSENSLGQLRIDMPNRQAVYMHDTPSKRLFAQDARFHSSGCVRVADIHQFVQWLLEGTPSPSGSWHPADIEAAIAVGKRQDVRLAKPVPVVWVYLTGYASGDGTVHFRDDIYDLDNQPAPGLPPPSEDLTTSSLPRQPAAAGR